MTLPRPGPGDHVGVSWYRVLYADTDVMGIVNNAHYFRFFEQARGDYLRGRGIAYSEVEARGVRTPLTEAWAHFYQPFAYDDLIRMEGWVSMVKKASFMFEYRLFRGEEDFLRVAGRTLHATLNLDNKVVKIPSWLLDILEPAGGS